MELKSINKNITLAFTNPVSGNITTSNLQDIATSVFSDETIGQPITVTFPDVVNMFIPDKEMGVSINGKISVFFDQKVAEIEEERIRRLALLAYKANEILNINDNLEAFGFNYVYEIIPDDEEKLKESLEKIMNTDITFEEGMSLKLFLPDIVISRDQQQIELKFEAQSLTPQLETSHRYFVSINSHREKSSYPSDVTQLKALYLQDSNLKSLINKILKPKENGI